MRIRQDCRTGFLYVLSSRCVFYNNLISRLPILLGSAKWETTGVLVRRLEVFPEKPEKPCRAAGPVPFATLRPCAYSLASEYDVRALRCPQTGQWVLIGYMGV